MNRVPEFPKQTKKDKCLAGTVDGVKTGLAVTTVVGGHAVELFQKLFPSSYSKRMEDWFKNLAAVVNELVEKHEGLSIESLSKNEQFLSTVFWATQMAMRTHQEEKLSALRAAVQNSAINSIDEDLQTIFLSYLDSLTPSHLRLLSFFENPKEVGRVAYMRQMGSGIPFSRREALEEVFPDLKGKKEIYGKLIDDLHTYGLISQTRSNLGASITFEGAFGSDITEVGKNFLKFIRPPQK